MFYLTQADDFGRVVNQGFSAPIRTLGVECTPLFRVRVAIVCGSFLIFSGLLNVLSAFDSRVCGLWLIIGDCPSVADFHRTRYAFLVAQYLYAP